MFAAVKDEARLATINRIVHVPAAVPGLTQNDSSVEYCNAEKLPNKWDIATDNQPVYLCSHQIELELGKAYDVLMVDVTAIPDNASHPMHFHGHAFQVIDMGFRDQLATDTHTNATHAPVIKDTVVLPRQGFVRIRFR